MEVLIVSGEVSAARSTGRLDAAADAELTAAIEKAESVLMPKMQQAAEAESTKMSKFQREGIERQLQQLGIAGNADELQRRLAETGCKLRWPKLSSEQATALSGLLHRELEAKGRQRSTAGA